MTSLECICAAGWALPPLVVSKGTSFKSRYLPIPVISQVRNWQWTTSNTGWSFDTLAFEWITHVFKPTTISTTSTIHPRRLLIVNGHGSYVKAPFITLCLSHSIGLMILPYHLSHKTQPLNVVIFGPLKRALAKQTNCGARYKPGSPRLIGLQTSLVLNLRR